jgi:hypothetical protein
MRLELAAPACVAEDFGEEIVAINLDSGVYFSIRGVGAAIWKDLAAGHELEAVREALSKNGDLAGAALDNFVQSLLDRGLMRGSDGTSPTSAMACSASGLASSSVLTVDAYDDMAELFKADPIHEVDEQAGWPVLRESGSRDRAA